MSVPAWRAALRIARREAWRAKGRSMLIVLMVALPVFAASAAVITYRSQQLDTGERLARVLGRADALVWSIGTGGRPVTQDPADGGKYDVTIDEFDILVPSDNGIAVPAGENAPAPPDVPATIPAGSTVLTRASGTVAIRTAYGLTSTLLQEFDYAAPLVRGIVHQTAGRAPRTADEIAVTDKLLDAGGLRVGGTVTELTSGKVFTVVGTVELPDALDARQAFTLPGAVLDRVVGGTGNELPLEYFVDAPPGAYAWDHVRKLNESGIVATSREAATRKLPDSEVPYRAVQYHESTSELTVAVTVVVIGMALLEVVLLAGPAFAVGARRRRRDLGLVGVAGGDRRHIRTIVLADGVVLGVVAGILGTALGTASAWLMRDWFGETSGKRLGHFDARPTELLAVALLGLVIGVVSAWVPAFLAARENVVDSLSGRRGVRHGSKALPIVGATMGAVGLGLAYYGSRVDPSDAVLLTGCVLAELGLIACCPMLLGAAGRLGRFLPLTPRLALRDAARNRPRAAPAVAAVMAAIAGAVSVTAYWAGTEHDERAQYRPSARTGQVTVILNEVGQQTDAVRRAVEETLPVAGEGIVRGFGYSCPPGQQECLTARVVVPPPNECPVYPRSGDQHVPTPAEIAAARKDPRCMDPLVAYAGYGVPVGDAELVRRITGAGDDRIPEALKHGAVVFDKRLLHDGKVTVEIATTVMTEPDPADPVATTEEPPPPHVITVPGIYVDTPGGRYTTAVLGDEAARATGVAVTDLQLLYDTTKMPGEAAEQRAREAVNALGAGHLTIERGYQGRPDTRTLLLAAATIVVALGAAGVATGLALADSRRDLATLGAVGAPPRVRRTLSAAQSWVIALLGTGLGVVAGLLPAAALRWKEAEIQEGYRESALAHGEFMNLPDAREIPVIVPWAEMGVALVVIPLLAAVVAALFTRSRELHRTRAG